MEKAKNNVGTGTTRKPANKAATATGNKPAETKKKGFIGRAYDKVHNIILSVKATKGDRIAIRMAKGAGAGFALYGTYKLGQRSIRPTVVTVTPINEEQKADEEIPAEELDKEEEEQEQEYD